MCGKVPWAKYLDSLRSHGFDGTVILELPPENLLRHDGLADLARSVEVVRGS